MKFLITGGTGFIGQNLCKKLLNENHQITILSRNKNKVIKIFGNDVASISSCDEIANEEKFDAVINLAGEGIAEKRWSEKQKEKLLNSRVKITKNLIELFFRLKNKPEIFISASAIGFYGSHDAEILNEDSKPNNEFTHQLCQSWENEARKAEDFGIRTCITRFGVVLGKNGGSIKKLEIPFKLGLGGRIGDGSQYFSWVHIDDVILGILFLVNGKNHSGIFNLTAPQAVTNSQFTKALGKALQRPTIFPMPALMVKILFGEMGESLLLKGQRVFPKKLLESGFSFKYQNIDSALEDIF